MGSISDELLQRKLDNCFGNFETLKKLIITSSVKNDNYTHQNEFVGVVLRPISPENCEETPPKRTRSLSLSISKRFLPSIIRKRIKCEPKSASPKNVNVDSTFFNQLNNVKKIDNLNLSTHKRKVDVNLVPKFNEKLSSPNNLKTSNSSEVVLHESQINVQAIINKFKKFSECNVISPLKDVCEEKIESTTAVKKEDVSMTEGEKSIGNVENSCKRLVFPKENKKRSEKLKLKKIPAKLSSHVVRNRNEGKTKGNSTNVRKFSTSSEPPTCDSSTTPTLPKIPNINKELNSPIICDSTVPDSNLTNEDENANDSSLNNLILDCLSNVSSYDMPIFDLDTFDVAETSTNKTPDEKFPPAENDAKFLKRQEKNDEEILFFSVAPMKPYLSDVQRNKGGKVYFPTMVKNHTNSLTYFISAFEKMVHIFKTGYLMELDYQRPFNAYTITLQKLNELDFALTKMKEKNSTSSVTTPIRRKFEYLTCVFRAVVTFRVYSTQTSKVEQNFRQLDDYHERTAKDVRLNNNVSSSDINVPPGFVLIPRHLETLYKEQTYMLRGLVTSHQCWSKAKIMRNVLDSSFYTNLDVVCGQQLSLTMDVNTFCSYILTALKWILDYHDLSSRKSFNQIN